MFPYRDRRLIYVRELFEELGVLKNGEWEERYSASLRKSVFSSMGDGKKESSQRWTWTRRIAINFAGSKT